VSAKSEKRNLNVIGILVLVLLADSVGKSQPTNSGSSASSSRPEAPRLIDLPTALRLAKAQNLDVQIARERLNEARAVRQSALELFFPWLSPAAGYRRHEDRIQDVAGNIIDADKQSYTVGGTITAQAELGDAIYKSLASKQLVVAADQRLESQRQDSTLAAALGYFDLANARALVEVEREAMKISHEYQKQLHEAVGIGIAFKGDELRVQVQTERYQLALRQAQERQRVAAARLTEVLHLDAAVELEPEQADLVPVALADTNAAIGLLIHQALESRPEIAENQALVLAALHAKNGAVYGPLVPFLGAQAFGGGLGGGTNDHWGSFGPSQDYAVTLGWRIGPGGLLDFGRTRAAKARLETTKLTAEKIRDEIARQVVESHTRFHSLQDQLETTRQNLATASEALRLTRERKQFGVGAVLEDIDSQQELTRARSDYLTAVSEYNKAQYALLRATGAMAKAEEHVK
jgi:outer membrane protein TolC